MTNQLPKDTTMHENQPAVVAPVEPTVGPLVARLRKAAHAMDVNMDAMLMSEAADALEAAAATDYQRMFFAAVSALAEIDSLLGVEEHGCNDPQQTVSALKDVLANKRRRLGKRPNVELTGLRRKED